MKTIFVLVSIFLSLPSLAQVDVQKTINETLASKWYEKLNVRGYAHFRYNRSLESNKDFRTPYDRSVGDKQSFFFRRARLVIFGEVTDRVFVYIQPDYSQDATQAIAGGQAVNQQNYLQMRDAYFDYALTEDKEFRLRVGLTKVPFGWENMQSSANRAPLDRSDAMNSAAPNERDTGVFLLYAPTEIRALYKEMTANSLKGTGDYGMINIGAYNGQTMNRPEENNDLYRVVRLNYPMKLKSGQFIEASLQAYEGKFNELGPVVDKDYYDARQGASLVYYPQPIGIQAEYNIGTGAGYDQTEGRIRNQKLKGGYVMVSYQHLAKTDRYFPFVRFQEYNGGKKFESGTPMARVREWEFGAEWQPNPAFELTAAYAIANRHNEQASGKYNERGELLRLQMQFNY